ncbi:hypothetical protein RchiOBHm_Chr1g0329711 [Rosa chinensis]|uniref:Uncharacterized protein n=1 Tax=Rosa chinensis TaxID=74649 RepID=A0A2P6SB30_ROSCH|nr:hypothetical protein RchiOBHm_Chr1g0329711 [Rosa chinensis]
MNGNSDIFRGKYGTMDLAFFKSTTLALIEERPGFSTISMSCVHLPLIFQLFVSLMNA